MPETFSDLRAVAQARFASLLLQICEAGGLSQGKLARMAQADVRWLLGEGTLGSNDPIGSLGQPTISRILAGKQQPTYGQVYIFLRAIRAHYTSSELTRRCEKCGLSVPVFSREQELALWTLAGFCSPDELARELKKGDQSTAFVALPPKHARGWIRPETSI